MAAPAVIVPSAPEGLTLLAVFPRSDIGRMLSAGCVQLGSAWHIGLRQRLEDAVDRETRVNASCDKHSHVVLQVTFTPLGLAYYARTCAGSEGKFKPILHKMEYAGHTDWQVWHFLADLPLSATDLQGNLLISTEWLDIM